VLSYFYEILLSMSVAALSTYDLAGRRAQIGWRCNVKNQFAGTVQAAAIAMIAPFLVGTIAIAVMNMKGAEAAIETHHLPGKVFFVRGELGGDSQETGWRRWVVVMTAIGTDSKLLTQALDGVHDLVSETWSSWIIELVRRSFKRWFVHIECPWPRRCQCIFRQD
jgi:hypothetical protein